MAWNHQRSLDRVTDEYNRLKETNIEVIPLTREMNFDNLSPANCRLVHGAHLYADIPNMSWLINHPTYKKEDKKRLIRCIHVMEKEQIRIVEKVFDGYKIHFQGPKIHAVFHKPYQDDEGIAKNAVMAAITLQHFIESVFNYVFTYPDFHLGIGIDLGDVIVTNIGNPGDRELISLGSPANIAAKVQGQGREIVITEHVFDCLPEELQQHFEEKENDFGTCYSLKRYGWKSLFDEINEMYNIDWSEEGSRKRVEDDISAVSLNEIKVREAQTKIDKTKLSIRNNRTALTATIFVDVSGFTKYVSDAEENNREALVRRFHLLRYELRNVAVRDFEGVRIQYQGDRMQAIFHVPKGDEERICQEAVNAAIGCQSSMEEIINQHFQDGFDELHIAVGCELGNILVTRLGKKGDLDVICLGKSVYLAEALEEKAEGTEIKISATVYGNLTDETIKEFFQPNSSNTIYTATGLTWEKVWAKKRAKEYDEGKQSVYIVSGPSAGRIVSRNHVTQEENIRSIKTTRPWASE